MRPTRTPLRFLALGCLLLLAGCRITDLPLWTVPEPTTRIAVAVKEVRDVAYYEEKDGGSERHTLDVFLPRDKQDFPVVVLVHGGTWMIGDNRCCGLYTSVGQFLASQGIAAVLPNYRLSPGVKHPEHIKDVARVVAWTHKNIGKYGGDVKQLHLVGHSAGGHLVALLTTDEQYLKAEGLRSNDLKGVVAVSGVYDIPAGPVNVRLGGWERDSVHSDVVLPIRGTPLWDKRLALSRGVPVSVNIFGPVFGDDPAARAAASPLQHVRPGLPPLLLISAEKDLPTLAGMAESFHDALQCAGCQVQHLTIPRRNHNTILFNAVEPTDPVARAVLDFIQPPRQPR